MIAEVNGVVVSMTKKSCSSSSSSSFDVAVESGRERKEKRGEGGRRTRRWVGGVGGREREGRGREREGLMAFLTSWQRPSGSPGEMCHCLIDIARKFTPPKTKEISKIIRKRSRGYGKRA